MPNLVVSDQRYRISRRESVSDSDQFFNLAVAGKLPVEIISLSPGGLASLPKSDVGQTEVSYVGDAPFVAVETDKFGNLQLCMPKQCVIEVVFSSEKIGAVGRNRGPHPRKIVYTVR